ncbi:hypothetical protein [Sorangium sp. So ce131]|uniref:hypothetical protein n=1 Tax=Sorangium sp. So ce131 TaxID=3133282 RepID=UPI003F60AD8B
MYARSIRFVCIGALLATTGVAACFVEEAPSAPEPPTGELAEGLTLPIDPLRSLAVTEEEIVRHFPLEEVLGQLIAQSGAPTTPTDLFNQWFDTFNDQPSGVVPWSPHCDDELTGGVASFNQFPWDCPRAEGTEALTDPFKDAGEPEAYIPIGLFNRFDLAPRSGETCGEYRIVYARQSGVPRFGGDPRNLLIFEAVLPNPHPECGVEACRPVAEFWSDLTAIDDVEARAKRLREFYFDGLPGFAPVVHIDHYGANLSSGGYGNSMGQIRTNSFIERKWMLREFKLVNDCRCEDAARGACRLAMLPITTKANPYPELWSSSFGDPRQPAFQSSLTAQVASLAIADINGFTYDVPDEFNSGQSVAQGGFPDTNDYAAFMDPSFRNDVQTALTAIGSALLPEHIADRATAQSCGGCHELSNGDDLGDGITWPFSRRFVHVDESSGLEPGPDGPRWPISQALTDVFLPFRQKILEGFLTTRPRRCEEAKEVVDPRRRLPLDCGDPRVQRAVREGAVLVTEEDLRKLELRIREAPFNRHAVH